ncbi:GNAT family N-acetyltransferase [Longispora sp. K20-0274]|uniref:GNAT family N-acetyltransferase n=1 Tax=Longispora sp. K20-0274 TaxID=3088255 RepID=UPI00399A23C9
MTLRLAAGPLTLRLWTDADAPVVLEGFRDPGVAAWALEPVTDLTQARARIRARTDGWVDGSRAAFAIIDTRTDAVLGQIGLRLAADEAEVGYWTLPEARGRGVASAALNMVADWAFGALDLTRIKLFHSVVNPASCRVAERGGFRLVAELDPTERWPAPGHLHMWDC